MKFTLKTLKQCVVVVRVYKPFNTLSLRSRKTSILTTLALHQLIKM